MADPSVADTGGHGARVTTWSWLVGRLWLCAPAVFLGSQERGDMRHLGLVTFADRPDVVAAGAPVVLHERTLAAFVEL